jgi:hypothetical protein
MEPLYDGGYAAYFRDNNLSIRRSLGGNMGWLEIPQSKGFVALVDEKFRMSFNRFKQLRGAFHPEDKLLADRFDDEFYQIRAALNEINAASLVNFIPDANCTFDGPRRKKNEHQTDNFRVDFFTLAGSKSNVIYHVDAHQGRKASGIVTPRVDHPTTMKALVKAVKTARLYQCTNDIDGYRMVALDHRYQCPQLAHLMWTR